MGSAMDLNLITTFILVAEYQSYTKAANHLGLTQPAVSSAIKRLETEVGKTLFIKRGRGIEPSPYAYQLIGHFRHALDTIESAINQTDTFTVSISEALLGQLKPIEHAIFQESAHDKHDLFEQLREQKIALALDTVIMKDSAFVVENAFREPLKIVCRKNHPRIQGKISKAEFYQEKHCLFIGKWDNLTGFEQIALEPLENRDIGLVTSSLASMALHVASSDMIATLSQSFIERWKDTLDLQVLDSPIKVDLIPYKFIYHKRHQHNPLHKEIRDNIRQQLHQLAV